MSSWWGFACAAGGASARPTVWGFTERLICWPGITHKSVPDLGMACFIVQEVQAQAHGQGGPVCITRCPPRNCQPHGVLEWSPADPAKVPFGAVSLMRRNNGSE